MARYGRGGNYRDNDTMRYAFNIAIFDTIRCIVPSLLIALLQATGRPGGKNDCYCLLTVEWRLHTVLTGNFYMGHVVQLQTVMISTKL